MDIAQVIATGAGSKNAAAIIRHAQRHPLDSATDPTKARLTDEGRAAARDLGRRLKGFTHLRLYHSPVMRCQETAACIAEGAGVLGMRIEECGARERLGFVCTKKEAEALTLYARIGDDFITRWLTGILPEGMMEDTAETVHANLLEICSTLDHSSLHGRRLDLHISHDWNIMVMRELLVGVRHEEAGWLGFLDGLVFERAGDHALEVRYRHVRRRGTLPWTEFIRR